MNSFVIYAFTYLIIVNIIAVILTVSDKRKAVKNKWRVSENSLIFIAFIGGAVCEYLTMKIIRHKTKHIKFTVGLPIIIFIHTVLLIFIIYKTAA